MIAYEQYSAGVAAPPQDVAGTDCAAHGAATTRLHYYWGCIS